jgi:stearoyl-CoA desaturase (delta-9 desaturase)
VLWVPFWAAGVVNGLGHTIGYRNYAVKDASRNLGPIGFLLSGEELHNNHHKYPSSAKFSKRWFEFDMGWVYIQSLRALGLAKVKVVQKGAPNFKIAKQAAIERARGAAVHAKEAAANAMADAVADAKHAAAKHSANPALNAN